MYNGKTTTHCGVFTPRVVVCVCCMHGISVRVHLLCTVNTHTHRNRTHSVYIQIYIARFAFTCAVIHAPIVLAALRLMPPHRPPQFSLKSHSKRIASSRERARKYTHTHTPNVARLCGNIARAVRDARDALGKSFDIFTVTCEFVEFVE